MTRPRSSTIYVKRRAVKVERAPVARPSKWQTVKKIAAWRAAQNDTFIFSTSNEAEKVKVLFNRPVLAEVERCLAHSPIAFPRKLWGEVL